MAKIALARGRLASSPFAPDLDKGDAGRIPGADSDDFLYIRKTGADTVRAGDGNDFIDVRDQDGGDLFDGGDWRRATFFSDRVRSEVRTPFSTSLPTLSIRY